MTQDLQGKTALVTGASRGIGAATAIALGKAGASRVILHYNSFQKGAEETAAALRGIGAQVSLIGADLSTMDGVHSLLDRLRSDGLGIDVLINNAGHLVQRAKLMEVTEELYDRVMTLNAKSMWFITQAVVPHMVSQGHGVVVNVSSIAARNGGGLGAAIYSASKAAVATMTKGLARELAPKGVRVNAVSPGTVDNYFHEKHSTPEMLKNVVAQTPAGRLGTNEEVADTILFLCTEPSRYIHGQTIEINGGMYMI